jgi:hypothetical protein
MGREALQNGAPEGAKHFFVLPFWLRRSAAFSAGATDPTAHAVGYRSNAALRLSHFIFIRFVTLTCTSLVISPLKKPLNPATTSAMKTLLILVSVLLLSIPTLSQQQEADLTFDASVKNPAYTTTHPKVLFDEAHFNFHTAGGRYKPFADMVTNDGYRVTSNKEKFAAQSLNGFDVLVIANAGAAQQGSADRSKPAFTDAECDAVREWVRGGGALLLIADHAPAGAAAAILASRFDVDMSKGFTADRSTMSACRSTRVGFNSRARTRISATIRSPTVETRVSASIACSRSPANP